MINATSLFLRAAATMLAGTAANLTNSLATGDASDDGVSTTALLVVSGSLVLAGVAGVALYCCRTRCFHNAAEQASSPTPEYRALPGG
ncbi:MAG: hypothetical protein Q7V63_08605 [Gammaproteobacteria bacterium]|nr:hypothetical protein [Gammaproteobacteria bacterium]